MLARGTARFFSFQRLAVIVLCSVGLSAQQYGIKGEPAAMSMDYNPLLWRGDDAAFASDMLHSSYCVSAISKTVAAKTSDRAVQDLALTVAFDQQRVYRSLRGMARTIDFPLPSKRELSDCPDTARLEELSGPELDRGYIAFLSKNAPTDVSRFEAETEMPHKPWNWSLWKFAWKTLPVIRQDASAVKSVEQKLAPPPKK